jgi:hypothetical protein
MPEAPPFIPAQRRSAPVSPTPHTVNLLLNFCGAHFLNLMMEKLIIVIARINSEENWSVPCFQDSMGDRSTKFFRSH